MKLRISGNSIRLRLLRPEVEALGNGATLEESVQFGSGDGGRFGYALESARVPGLAVEYMPGCIRVCVPAEQAKLWAAGDEVGIYGDLPAGPGQTLRVMIEKDFACLDRSDAENAGTFDHPKAGHTC